MATRVLVIECKDEVALNHFVDNLDQTWRAEAGRQEWLDYEVVDGRRVPLPGLLPAEFKAAR